MTDVGGLSSSDTSLVIPHGISWFKASPTACSPWTGEDCDLAFMSYEFVCIYRLRCVKSEESSGYYFSFLSRFKAHEQNVHSIAFPMQFSEGPSEKCFITCGNDCALRIWSNASDTYALNREIYLGREVVPNTCSVCVISGSLCILSPSLNGHIVIWEPSVPQSSSNPFLKKFSKFSASSCLWAPLDNDGKSLLAIVGFINGDICGYTYDRSTPINKNSCSQTFKTSAHNFEVCSLIALTNVANDGLYFASAGRDSEIRFWSIEDTQCKYSYRFKVSKKSNNTDQDSSNPHGKAWIPLAPTGIESPLFLAFDSNGNLYAFNCTDRPHLCEPSISSFRHTSLVFSLLSIPNSPHLFISFGKDSQIIAWKKSYNDWHTLTPVASIPCLPGKISCISQAPGLYSPLAVGLSDGSLLIMRNIIPPEPNSFISVSRHSPLPPSGSAIGISALAWYPNALSENLLAIGSSKGHVDIVDIQKNQKRGRNFNYLGGCVYRVAWGPPLFELSNKGELSKSDGDYRNLDLGNQLLVYAVANGAIHLLISTKQPLTNLTSNLTSLLSNSDDHKLADITFRRMSEDETTSYSWLVGLGSMNGAINVFGLSRINGISLVSLCRIDIHKKCIVAMVWSHHTDKYWLAVGSGETFITIIDVTEQATNTHPEECSQSLQFTTCLATLQGHGTRVSALDWSPTDPDLLLSGSYDCTAIVWRVGLGSSTAIANYRDHLSRLHACAWSPDIPDFVLTAENFGFLIGWHPSTHSAGAPTPSRKNRNPCGKIPSCANSEQVKEESQPAETEPTPIPPPPKRSEACMSKKPSLLPSLFATSSVADVSLPVLTISPPIRMQSRFEIITDFLAYMRDPLSFENARIMPEFDLLCGGGAQRRRELVRFTESEALKHLASSSSGPNRSARLDAYFSLLLWLGRGQVVAKKSIELQYTPFWLMWALEMMMKGSALRPVSNSLVESELDSPGDTAPDDFLKHKILSLTGSNEYTWASTLLVCAGRTAEAVQLLLQCSRAKEALLLFRLRLNPEANSKLLARCLSLLAERQAHTGLPNSALAFLAAGEIDKAVAAVRGNSEANLPALDRMVTLWTSLAIVPSSPVIPIKLAQACITYAANLSIEHERRQFLDSWRAAFSPGSNADYLLACGSFLLLSEKQETTLSFPADEVDKIARIVSDRQPSLEESECLAGVVLDFGVAALDAKYIPILEKSLEVLKQNHPDAFFNLGKKMSLRKSESSGPSVFMSENKTVVIEEHQRHSVSEQTLKPVFIYSREEYFDAPQPSQKSHQVSTLCVPRESPDIVSMPKQLPSYVMSGEQAVPNAHLVRRRIDYQEVAEYRVLQPTGATTTILTKSLNAPSLRKPLFEQFDESSLDNTDERISISSSTSSSSTTRRRRRIAAPTDRILRSQDRRSGPVLQQTDNFDDHGTISEKFASTPLGSASRQDAIRRRATEIEEGEEESTFHLSGDANTTPNWSEHRALSRLSVGNDTINASSRRPWHLSSMLGLSAEPTYRNPPQQVRGTQNYRESTSIFPLFSFSSKASQVTSSICRRLGSCLLNLIVIPLILLHCLYLGVRTVGKAAAAGLSRLFHGITEKRSQSNVRSKSLFSFQSGPSYTLPVREQRLHGETVSPLFFSGCPSSCCIPLFLLLLLLLSSILLGFIFRSGSGTGDSLSEDPYLFGLLPSDAECLRRVGASGYIIDAPEKSAITDSHLPYLRWNCLSACTRPTVGAIHQYFSVWWDWITQPLLGYFSPSTSTEELSPSEPTPRNIDDLLERLKRIDAEMADLRRQVAELRESHSARVSAHAKEYGALTANMSQFQAVIASLKEQITALSDGVGGEIDDQRRQRLIDELSKQAAFVSTASLDARLQELRSHLEAITAVPPPTGGTAQKESARIEAFEKALSELSTIVRTQRTDLEEKLTNLKLELEISKKEHNASLKDINSKISKEVVFIEEKSQTNFESRLSSEIGKIASRIDSLERLNTDLEEALKKLVAELSIIRKDGVSNESDVSKVRIEELFTEMKASFYDKLAADLRKKITDELSHSTESGSALQMRLLTLIRAAVDERLRETFTDKTEIAQMETIPMAVVAYIDKMLETFAADGTGKADFALESAGSTVVSTRCTRTYNSFKSAISFFGITLAYWSRSPNEILQPGNHPGECWCFYGSEGQAIVRLAVPVHVTGISLEHIPKALAHTGRIDSAPRDFVIKALKSESDGPDEGEILGEFVYDESGKPIQYFAVNARADGKPTRFVELVVNSNHGHPEYTCIYRLRVHGRMSEEGDD
ncbi:hypothetical protein Aperf_G00000083075 [Anoplocephala perfoliata]